MMNGAQVVVCVLVITLFLFMYRLCYYMRLDHGPSQARSRQQRRGATTAVRERAMRVVTVDNRSFTCDPISDGPIVPVHQSTPLGTSVFPDNFALPHSRQVLECPPPSYEEAIRATTRNLNAVMDESTK